MRRKRVALVVRVSNNSTRPNTCGGRDHKVSAVGGARDRARGGGYDPTVRAKVEHGGARRIAKGTAVGQPVRFGPGVARGRVAHAASSEAGVVLVVAPKVLVGVHILSLALSHLKEYTQSRCAQLAGSSVS